MTVEELINELKKYPRDDTIVVAHPRHDYGQTHSTNAPSLEVHDLTVDGSKVSLARSEDESFSATTTIYNVVVIS